MDVLHTCAEAASGDGVGGAALVLAGVFVAYITVSVGVSSFAILNSSETKSVAVGKADSPPMLFS